MPKQYVTTPNYPVYADYLDRSRGISFGVQTDDPGSLRSGKRHYKLPLLGAAAIEP